MDKAVYELFGFNAVQLGLPRLHALANNRMPNRWVADDLAAAPGVDLVTRFDALPFPEQSVDLVVLPHTLDLADDPHATLREVERILVPEGRVVIASLNPASLWGLRQRRVNLLRRLGARMSFLPPHEGAFLGYWRLRDWLRLLGFEIEAGSFGCYRPALRTQRWLDRMAWMDPAGDRWWPIFGAAFQITAVKRVRGMHLIGPAWAQGGKRVPAPAVAAPRAGRCTPRAGGGK